MYVKIQSFLLCVCCVYYLVYNVWCCQINIFSYESTFLSDMFVLIWAMEDPLNQRGLKWFSYMVAVDSSSCSKNWCISKMLSGRRKVSCFFFFLFSFFQNEMFFLVRAQTNTAHCPVSSQTPDTATEIMLASKSF